MPCNAMQCHGWFRDHGWFQSCRFTRNAKFTADELLETAATFKAKKTDWERIEMMGRKVFGLILSSLAIFFLLALLLRNFY